MGGLELAAGEEEGAGPSPLQSVVMKPEGERDFGSLIMDATRRAREHGAMLPGTDAPWKIAVNAGDAPPTQDEIRAERDRTLAEYDQRAQAARSRLQRPPQHDWIPFMRGMAGAMAPTKTGSFGESLGHGLGEFASGMSEQDKAAQLFAGKEANLEHQIGSDRAGIREKYLGREMNSAQIAASLALARTRMRSTQYNTPAIKEWMVTQGLTADDIESNRITPQQKQDLNKMILLARGSTGMKDALSATGLGGLDPGNPNFGKLAAVYGNQKMVSNAWTQADKLVPREQYIGRPPEEYEAARKQMFHRIIQSYVSSPITGDAGAGGGGGGGGPAAAPAAPGPAAPRGAAVVEPGASQGPLVNGGEPPKGFVDYVTSKAQAWSQNPRIIQDSKSREKMDAAAVKDYEENVLPLVHSGEEAMNAVNSLDAINPMATPVSGLVEALGKAGSVFGLPADNALVKNAAQIGSASKVVEQLRNSILIKAKGVQTEGDAQRALTQIGSLRDMKEVYEATKTLMRAIAQRGIDKGEFYNRYGEINAGQFTGANTEWAKHASSVPLMVKVNFKGGESGYMTYQDFIDQHIKAGDTMDQALAALKAKARGGS